MDKVILFVVGIDILIRLYSLLDIMGRLKYNGFVSFGRVILKDGICDFFIKMIKIYCIWILIVFFFKEIIGILSFVLLLLKFVCVVLIN